MNKYHYRRSQLSSSFSFDSKTQEPLQRLHLASSADVEYDKKYKMKIVEEVLSIWGDKTQIVRPQTCLVRQASSALSSVEMLLVHVRR